MTIKARDRVPESHQYSTGAQPARRSGNHCTDVPVQTVTCAVMEPHPEMVEVAVVWRPLVEQNGNT